MFDAKGAVIGGNATDKALLHFLTQEQVDKYKNVSIKKEYQILNKR